MRARRIRLWLFEREAEKPASRSTMDPRLQRLLQNMGGGGGGGPVPDAPAVDTAEKVHISSLALLKMLKHGESSPQSA